MKINFLNAIAIPVLLFIAGCDDGQNRPGEITGYPVSPGTEWTYDRQVSWIGQNDDPAGDDVYIDSVRRVLDVRIEKDTILNDTMPVVIFRSLEVESGLYHVDYKYIDDEGLKTYARSNSSDPFFTIRHGRNLESLRLNPGMNSRMEAFFKYSKGSGTIFIENPPLLDIQFPLGENSSWIYRNPTEGRELKIEKYVAGRERLNVKGGDFDCYKIKWEYLYDERFNGMEVTEWIAREGLIKIQMVIDSLTLTKPSGETVAEGARYTDTYTLKKLDINQSK